MKRLFCIFILSLCCQLSAFAADTSGDGTDEAIQAWHDLGSTVDGNTYTINAGSFTIDTTVVLTKAVTIQGAGVGQTIITDAVNTGNGRAIQWTTEAGKEYRLTGIEFVDGKAGATFSGVVAWEGLSESVRMDNLEFGDMSSFYVWVGGSVFGVADNCTFNGTGNDIIFQHQQGTQFGGDAGLLPNTGDESWESATNWGSANAWFIENCTFNGGTVATDGWRGSRFVVRYCTINGGNVQNHGTESSQRFRGGRSMEVYENTFDGSVSAAIYIRSGTALIHNNTFNGTYTNAINLVNYRHFQDFLPWHQADGTLLWDTPDLTDTGTGEDTGAAGDGVFTTGTLTATSGNSATDSSKSWTPDQWKNYVMRTEESLTATSGTYGGVVTVTVAGANWIVGETGTATGGNGTTTLVRTGAGWTVDYFIGAVIRHVGADGLIKQERITDNTEDTITFTGSLDLATYPSYTILDQWAGYQLTVVGTGEKGAVASNTADTLTLGQYYYRPDLTLGGEIVMSLSRQIASNTSDTLTLVSNSAGGTTAPRNGVNFKIQKILQALDQPGTGLTTNITGDSTGGNPNYGNPPHQDLNQALDPIYYWGNTFAAGIINEVGAQEGIRLNEHYYAAQLGGYTPYTYPHPLVSAAPSSGASVTVGGTLRVGP